MVNGVKERGGEGRSSSPLWAGGFLHGLLLLLLPLSCVHFWVKLKVKLIAVEEGEVSLREGKVVVRENVKRWKRGME